MSNEQIQAIAQATFSGLAFFHRDTTLGEELIARYHPGQILQERAFTDMSYKGGGLTGNVRYLIASAFGKNLGALVPEAAATGHIVLIPGAFFKVLDVYEAGGKTQVILLNIPDNAVEFFAKATTNIEQDIVQKGRAAFEQALMQEPVPELLAPAWRQRTQLPVGMSDKGELFYQL
jgi:hypothetical protein